MEVIADFFVDPLVWPAYLYFAAYGFVWIIAWALARLFMNQRGVESAAALAWGIAIIMHILGGTGLIVWLSGRAHNRFPEWWYIPFYLIFYIVIMIVDVCLLFSLITRNSRRKTTDVPLPKTSVKPINPKKKA